MMKDQFVLHLEPLLASSDLRGIICSSIAKAAKAKEYSKSYEDFIIHKQRCTVQK